MPELLAFRRGFVTSSFFNLGTAIENAGIAAVVRNALYSMSAYAAPDAQVSFVPDHDFRQNYAYEAWTCNQSH